MYSYAGKHELDGHDLIPWSSDGPVDFNSNSIVKLYKLNTPLIKAHGNPFCCLLLFFGFYLSVTSNV